ncbi:MAG: hypothetical protein ACI4GW_04585 [Lachnospiraceae bacterium]
MKMNDTLKGALLIFVGIIAAVVSFMYVAQPNIDKTRSIQQDNVTLRARLAELEAKQAERDRYLEETAQYNAEYDALLNSFPADLNQEVTIMFIEGIRENYEFDAESLTMGVKEQFYTLGVGGGDASLDAAAPVEATEGETTTEVAAEETTEAPADSVLATSEPAPVYDCYRALFPISYSGSYESIKDVVSYVDNYTDRMTINQIDISYDAENDVYSGNIQLYCYSIEGEDRPERTVELNEVETGVNNIFNSGASVSSTVENSLSKYDDTEGSAIETSYDFYTMLNPASSDVSAKLVGQNGSGKDASIVSNSDNSISTVTYDFYEKDGKTYCKYTVDNENSYEAEVTSAEDVKLLIKSSDRKDGDDKVGVRVTINNSSNLPVYVKVSGDDSVNPRVTIAGKSGSVKVYK